MWGHSIENGFHFQYFGSPAPGRRYRRGVGGIGAVVIGRNEGERLLRCLDSVLPAVSAAVYVDSGSTDGSREAARARGAGVVELDPTRPFTAARARNEGARALVGAAPDTEAVLFVDGDCELDPDFVAAARARLEGRDDLAVVCGRRRERFPEASVFNLLCDVEWDTPVGEAEACGGDALVRRVAFEEVGGFRDGMIAGEEPELCVRLRLAGWRIERIAAEMTLHDAALTRPSQWWQRMRRAGHAYAEGFALHGRGPTRHNARAVRSIGFWGAALPAVAIAAAPGSGGASLLLLLGWPVLAARVYRTSRRAGLGPRAAAWYGASCALGKLPQALGAVRYAASRALRRETRIIEYKGAAD